MIRESQIVDDIQLVFKACFQAKITEGTNPWDTLSLTLAFPNSELTENLTSPVLYIKRPEQIDFNNSRQYGGYNHFVCKMTIGLYVSLKAGGEGTLARMESTIRQYIEHFTIYSTVFTVTLGTTTYTNTKILTQGINIREFMPFETRPTDSKNTFRSEMNLILICE